MIYCYMLLNSLYYIYLVHAESNKESVMNTLEYLNELSLLALLYAMLFYVKTNQLDALVVWDAGVAAIAILSTAFLINLGYLVVSSVRKSIRMGRLKVIRHKRLQAYRMARFKKKITTREVCIDNSRTIINDW